MSAPLHPKAIAKFLEVRAVNNLSQERFANRVGVDASTIKHAENGAAVRHTTLVRIARGISELLTGGLKISAQDLVNGTIAAPPQTERIRLSRVPDSGHLRRATHPIVDIVARLLTPYLSAEKAAAIVAECVLATSSDRSGPWPQSYNRWKRAADLIRRHNNTPSPRSEFVIAELELRLECFSALHLTESRPDIRRTAFRVQYLFDKPCILPEYLGARFLSELGVQCYDCGRAGLAIALSKKAQDRRSRESGDFPERTRWVENVVARRDAHIIMANSPVEAGVRLTELRKQWADEGNLHGVAVAAFSTLCNSRIHESCRTTLRLLESLRSALDAGGPFVEAMSLALQSRLVHEDGRTDESKELADRAVKKLKHSQLHVPKTPTERERLICRPDRILGSEQLDEVGELIFTGDEISGFVKSVGG